MFRTSLFGYNRREVDRYIHDLELYVETLRQDVEFLKREQRELRGEIEKLIMSEKIYGNLDRAQDIVREYQ